jgi:tRNA threonylcarbamoyl adenosine modification protein YjeE
VQPVTELISRDPESTVEAGRRIGRRLEPGVVLSLEGVLGSGKTTLVKGIAQALEIQEPVTSPTFTLVSQYEGRREGRGLRLVRHQPRQELGTWGWKSSWPDASP